MTTREPPIPISSLMETDIDDAADETEGFDRAFVVVSHGGVQQLIDLPDGREINVGRTSEADVRVQDSKSSRRHATIRREGNAIWIRDLGSRNGTRVGTRTLENEEARVVGGDVIRIGATRLAIATFTGVREPNPRTSEGLGSEVPEGVAIADAEMKQVFQIARRLARTTTTVLILGETGAGKEVLAQYIHRCSPRRARPFVRLNCSAIPASLLESELFGHEKGAFTGAAQRKVGYFEAAHEGTLFLDEVGEMPLDTQVKLLNVLENRCVKRIGGIGEIPVDCRVICATHRNLPEASAAGAFRQDLYYRISTFTLRLPPLRERPTEIMLLADLFAREFATPMGHESIQFAPSALSALINHRWPGNVRELRNAIEHAAVLADDGTIQVHHLPESIRDHESAQDNPARPVQESALRSRVEDIERLEIERALEAEGGNQTKAADRLGISRRTLVYRLKKYGIGRSE